MKTILKTAGAAVAAALISNHAHAVIISNPGFETGVMSPWYQDVNGVGENWNVTNTDAHSGNYSATATGNQSIRQDFAGAWTNSITELSFWLKHPNAQANMLAYDLIYTNGFSQEFVLPTAGTNWGYFNVTSSLQPGKVLTGINIYGYAGQRTFVDDIKLSLSGLSNPGFETGVLSPWYQDVNGVGENWNVTSAHAHSGTHSATATGNQSIRQDFSGAVTDTIAELSFWLQHPDPQANKLAYDLIYDDGFSEEFLLDTTGSDWGFYDVTSSLRKGKILSGISIYGYQGQRTNVDDITLKYINADVDAAPVGVPEPSALALAASVLAGVVVVRRRRTASARSD